MKATIFALMLAFACPILSNMPNDQGKEAMLLLNMDNTSVLPGKFRAVTSDISNLKTSLEGFKNLQISGSNQFSEESLKKILETLPSSQVIIVDLREESHGYVNGMAVGWYSGSNNWGNQNKDLKEIEADEQQKLDELLNSGDAFIYEDKSFQQVRQVYVEKVCTESDLASSLGAGYIRIPVTDHQKPSEAIVDSFVQFVLQLPEDAWLHIHCSGGKGRATTFMAMYDMMHNATCVSFDDIIRRHHMIGGIDLLLEDMETWKHDLKQDRVEFLMQFYRYCQEHPDFAVSWQTYSSVY